MKSIVQKETAIKTMLEKKENELTKEMALLNAKKQDFLSKISLLQQQLINNPNPTQGKSEIDGMALAHYYSFKLHIDTLLTSLETQLSSLNEIISAKQNSLTEIMTKKKVFTDYFGNLKKQHQYVIDKREEAIIQDQYNKIKNMFDYIEK